MDFSFIHLSDKLSFNLGFGKNKVYSKKIYDIIVVNKKLIS